MKLGDFKMETIELAQCRTWCYHKVGIFKDKDAFRK